jgi:hypothetical protein
VSFLMLKLLYPGCEFFYVKVIFSRVWAGTNPVF